MSPSSTIAHYKLSAKLGEGGMGAVYRATDTKLNREVAIKILPPAFADDAARMARFEREAQVLASLNHPNIAAIYGIEQAAIVMELVAGADLKGPVSIDTAIDYARQMAAGLEAAHEKGIVHRDLKPANIKVTPDGTVKLLDFGLAKTTDDAPQTAATMSPTLSLAMTQAGMILGTAAYMSPEQARGKSVDKRADIWAFGVVLFELLTGKQPFTAGDTVTDTIAAVVTREPDWSALPAGTPPHIRRLLERCLRKDPKLRLRDIGDARLALDEPEATALTATPRRSIPWLAVGAALVLTAAASLWTGTRLARPVPAPPLRLSVDLGSADAVWSGQAVSPDGTRIVYSVRGANRQVELATRLLTQDKATLLSGTDGALYPFFSPDSQWIGFAGGGKLKKVSVHGGAPVPLCDAPALRGGAWSDDGSIVFTPNLNTGLWLLRDTGGTPERLTDPATKNQRTHRWPYFLPGGRAVLFTAHVASLGFDDAEIALLDLKTRSWKTVQRGGSDGRYLASGHLVFVRQGSLYAARFDLSRNEVTETPIPVLDDVVTDAITGGAQLASSAAAPGTLAYRSGKTIDPQHPISWVDASGNTKPLLTSPAIYIAPRLSPDSRLLAVSVGGMASGDIYVWDTQRNTRTQLTYNAAGNLSPVWMPDGKHLIFASQSHGNNIIWWMRPDGAGQPVKLLEGPYTAVPYSISPDGRRLAYAEVGADTNRDLFTLPLDLSDPEAPKAGKPEVFLKTPKDENNPMFSPDGRWIAYESDDTGQPEIYVRPFPGPGGKWVISTGSGKSARWSRDGKQIIYQASSYQANGGRLMVVDCQARGGSFTAGNPRPWGADRSLGAYGYDVTPDGNRAVAMVIGETEENKGNLHVTFLLNFFDDLKRRMP